MKMDSSDSEFDMLDSLAWNCTELVKQLNEVQTSEEQNDLIEQYLKRVDGEFEPINEFNDDLDWFNVSEPLTLKKTLTGKIVVLDFFTYCCINCMHILPDLKKLEQKFSIEDGLIVVGVHSAKFDNEKDSSNILSAVQRYNITHPVVNDSQSSLWMSLHITCWPTLIILGPRGNPLFVLMGEGHSMILEKYVAAAIKFYTKTNLLRNNMLPIRLATDQLKLSNLKFPGKITCSMALNDAHESTINSPIYALSDTGNHRILIINANGNVLAKIGGKNNGFVDGNFDVARFDSPQGVAFFDENTIIVADTENHAIREINLQAKTVKTIAGVGRQGIDKVGGKIGVEQEISSPWDISIHRTHDMDMSFHMDNERVPERKIILIAMAGTHQVWAIFKDDTIWWKFKKLPANTVASIAGNGHEENRNNSYPHNAAFAQPSGISLSKKHKELYVADSESSCIRRMSLTDGKVTAVVGGDRNPANLFAFGDVDGVQINAKLQHPLGVAYNERDHTLFVADTYNHKIKLIELSGNRITTCQFKRADTGEIATFDEPGGLCLSPCANYLYVCNTNRHSIDVIDLCASTVTTLDLNFNTENEKMSTKLKQITYPNALKIHTSAVVEIELKLKLSNDIKFTENAPQKWKISTPNDQWTFDNLTGSVQSDSKATNIGQIFIKFKSSAIENAIRNDDLAIEIKLSLCAIEKDVCFPKAFIMNVPIIYSSDGLENVEKSIGVSVGEKDISLA